MKTFKKATAGIVLTVVALLAYVSFLLMTTYTSQINLQQIILEQFRSENRWNATLISRFFNDRREDMQNLASSREIEVFYENRALGMSMQYGLRQSLPPIKERFSALVARKRADHEPLYLQISLLDEKGSPLVRAGVQGAARELPHDARLMHGQGNRASEVIVEETGKQIIISTAYYFKGKYSGQIIAWINPEYLARHYIAPATSSVRQTTLVETAGSAAFPGVAFPVHKVLEGAYGQPIVLAEHWSKQNAAGTIGVASPVEETPFSLVTFAPREAVLGNHDPRGLLFGMGVLAIVILGGGVYLVQATTKALLLQARLAASLAHTREMREKNLQLENGIAERRLAEQALRESEFRYRALVDRLPIAVQEFSPDGATLRVNAAWERMWKTPFAAIGNYNVLKDRQLEALGMRDLLQQAFAGQPVAFPVHEYDKALTTEVPGAGSRLFIRAFAYPVKGEDGQVLEVVLIQEDITERQQAEDALAESEATFRQLFENAADAMFLADMGSGVIVNVNRAATVLMAMPREKIIGLHQSQLHPVSKNRYSKESFEEHRHAVAAQALPVRPIENMILRSDGTEVPVEVMASEITMKGARYIIGTFRDITGRKQAEQALQSSEKRFRTIIEKASAGIQVVDAETGKVLYANPEICKMLGYSQEELCSFPITDLTVDDVPATPAEDFRKHARNDMHLSERELRRRDGSLLRMSIHSIPMEIDGRQCLVGFLSDISEKHLLEQERLKTQKLEAIGTLAGGIAHDFNNLLQGVFGYISLAKLTRDNRVKSTDALEQAEKALHMTVKLTNQLLTFSKGGKPVRKTIDLPPVVEAAARFALSGSRSNFRLNVENDAWKVDADEGQISQVIQNIVLNADQAMPDAGTVEILVRNVRLPAPNCAQTLAPGKYVEIAVTDTGIGIPDKYLRRIFDPYFTTKEKGSGLGLATSYSIIKNHNGGIDVVSGLGKGTTFRIYLPASESTAAAPRSRPLTTVPAKKARILLMDDDEVIRNAAGALIRVIGHDVEFASNGTEAVDKCRKALGTGNPYDIAILDLTIRGGMGGVEAVKRILEIDPGIKTIVSSGYADDATISSYLEHGFKAALKKPYNAEDLSAVLNTLLSA